MRNAALIRLLIIGGCLSSCQASPPYPAWYREINGLSGVNLPNIANGWGLSEPFLNHPDFITNLSGMNWNSFRVPIKWDQFATAEGLVDPTRLSHALNILDRLIEKLHDVYNAQGGQHRIFLILNFHQFKFGAICNGGGIPLNVIDTAGLTASDPLCIFNAFDRFWKSPAAQAGYIEFVYQFLEQLPTRARTHASWLTFGFDLFNEPVAGTTSPITDIAELAYYLKVEQNAQIGRYLVPFFEQLIDQLSIIPDFSILRETAVFIFEPFLLDHFDVPLFFSIGLRDGSTVKALRSDGDYSPLAALVDPTADRDQQLTWLAAPHHYDGAFDPNTFAFLPSLAKELLSQYPNLFFSKESVIARIQRQSDEFHRLGIEIILGEWGTYSDLKTPTGDTGGHLLWISDTLAAVRQYTKGALWWDYNHDQTVNQTSYNLLYATTPDQPASAQTLKCGDRFQILETVFGQCVTRP